MRGDQAVRAGADDVFGVVRIDGEIGQRKDGSRLPVATVLGDHETPAGSPTVDPGVDEGEAVEVDLATQRQLPQVSPAPVLWMRPSRVGCPALST